MKGLKVIFLITVYMEKSLAFLVVNPGQKFPHLLGFEFKAERG